MSPDSSRVVFVANKQSLTTSDLCSVPIAGGSSVKLNAPVATGAVTGFSLSPDGSRVLYRAHQGIPNTEDLYIVPITGGTPVRLNGPLVADGGVFQAAFSPSGSRVVYTADQAADNLWELFETHEEITVSLTSSGALDGWLLESRESSGAGGALNRTGSTLRVGDDALDRQYRGVLSFNTAGLPDNAVVLSAALRLRHAGASGALPFGTHGKLLVDLRAGPFSGKNALELKDFAARASRSGAAAVPKTPVRGWYVAPLGKSALPLINRKGLTQARLRFAKEDNDDGGADHLSLYSGNAPPVRRPALRVRYRLP